MKYDFKKIEEKWQKTWLKEKIYEPDLDGNKPSTLRPVRSTQGRPEGFEGRQAQGKKAPPFYNLMMFPYPSAEGLHVGNMYAFTGSDIYGRFKRMQGYDVFEPIGLDGFGIHSENYAIRAHKHPRETTKDAEENFYRQLQEIGNGFAWDEKLETYDPAYYKWTQWIFVQMFKHGLAYRKKQAVNWCPSCKTVLADEQVVGVAPSGGEPRPVAGRGECERCLTKVEKRELEQWFFRITDYAERLLNDLEKLDWSEKIKIAQRNWIGKSEGAFIKFPLRGVPGQPDEKHFVEVFTTRPDTIFGATFIAISSELAKQWVSIGWQASDEVKKYVEKTLAERAKTRDAADVAPSTSSGQEKIGVDTGIKAVNPATKEEVPVWVADYVLGDVGTGAIMAVPAHDERDFEFAKKFKIPIQQVVVPKVADEANPPRDGKENTRRNIVHCLLKHHTEDKIIALKSKKLPWLTPITGGVEDGEDAIAAAKREIREETGYKNFRLVKKMPFQIFAEFYAAHKDVNRLTLATIFLFELENEEKEELSDEEKKLHDIVWIPMKEIGSLSPVSELPLIIEWLKRGDYAYVGDGILINSGKFDGLDSEKARWEITKSVDGERKVQYHLRDWLISRQRYWGPPIPMIYCETCVGAGKGERKDMPGWYSVSEKDLPVKLPFVKDFRPKGTGQSPLATVKEFYEVKCPGCGATARRETDVSDTFLDSAWYYLRYLSSNDNRQPFDKQMARKWLPVDMYIGGAEHAVLHLLYVRFMAKVFHDWKLVDFDEPAKRFRAHGLLIRNGKKISKSKRNIVNPDDFVKAYGADALRLHLMFLGPFEDGGDFSDRGILGPVRFLDRVWRLSKEIQSKKTKNKNKALENSIHRTVKKVTEDIEDLRYNTAVSALMVLLNDFESSKNNLDYASLEAFLKLLAPFAPHITEELWSELGHKTSIHKEEWPKYDPEKVIEKTFTLVIQVNGRVRDTMEASTQIKEDGARRLALNQKRIKEILQGKEIKKIVFVPKKLINFVVP